MLDEGAGTRSSLELADAIEFLGASITTSSSFDASMVRLSSPVARLGDALPLPGRHRAAADVSREGSRAAAQGTAHQPAAGARQRRRARPARVPARRLRHRPIATARPPNGLPAAIESLTVDDLRTFYRVHYRPDNATLVVVGDVTPATVLPLLEKAFGGWKGEAMAPLTAAVPDGAAADPPADLPRGQAGRRAVADPHRVGRRAALHAGLRDARGAQHHSRRLVHLAAQPEPAREERLRLRRQLGIRHAPLRRDRSSRPPACRRTRRPTRCASSSSS